MAKKSLLGGTKSVEFTEEAARTTVVALTAYSSSLKKLIKKCDETKQEDALQEIRKNMLKVASITMDIQNVFDIEVEEEEEGEDE